MKQIFSVLFISTFLLGVSCKKNDTSNGGIFKGKETAIGNGAAFTTIELDQDNTPLSVGITLKPGSLTNLPQGDDMHHGYEYELELPAQKNKTPFDHAVMDWNPHGHPPENIYDKPHFDFHFYMASREEINNIPEYDEAPEKFDHAPDEGYLPANHIPIPGGEEKMGKHWVDVTSPELDPQDPAPFTQTFIYGSYDGKVNFYEPMVTKDFLLATPVLERTIPQPARYQKTGYYPSRMRITNNNNTIQIQLTGFQLHTAS